MKPPLSPIQDFYSLFDDGIYTHSKIEWWLLKYWNQYQIIKMEEAKRFMYYIDDKWVRLPDYFIAKTPNEKFIHLYNTIQEDWDSINCICEYT